MQGEVKNSDGTQSKDTFLNMLFKAINLFSPCSPVKLFQKSSSFVTTFYLFDRYGIHVSNNSYYICHSKPTIERIFKRIKTLENGSVSFTSFIYLV